MKEVSNIKIKKFSIIDAHKFSKLRINIEKETNHLLANKGERKENAIHVIAKLIISQRRTVTFLAHDNNLLIGYVSLVFPRFAKLRGNAYLTIALLSSYRGKGIGRTLMQQAEVYAKENGVRRIELEVFGENKKAINLYKDLNYVVEGVKKGAVTTDTGFDDIIIMTKHI
jgi:ribosomal protein S18 acetylase RimI-like enzyme